MGLNENRMHYLYEKVAKVLTDENATNIEAAHIGDMLIARLIQIHIDKGDEA